jgi:hypothetical protein
MKRFEINPDGTASYRVAEGKIVECGPALKKVLETPELLQKAVHFALGHIFRNATAGKMEKIDDAFGAVKERADALRDGKWAAHREAGEAGESRASFLALALAAVMQVTPAEAAEFISGEITTAMEEKGIDAEADSDDLTAEQKTERRKIANAVRKSIGEDPAVALKVATLKAEAAADKAKQAEADAKGKPSRFA